MARLKLSPSGLRSPLDLPETPDDAPSVVTITRKPVAVAAPPTAEPEATEPAAPAPAPAADEAPVVTAGPSAPAAPQPVEEPLAAAILDPLLSVAPAPAPAAAPPLATTASGPTAPAASPTDLPEWAAVLEPEALRPDRLLGRPKQTALILDRDLSVRADALVARTGPRVTFAAIVTAVLHFHLPADGETAARAIGGYRRRRLEALEHPWEERNARLPEPLRAELDKVVAGATGRVASVRRSTLVNALLDAHLPADAGGAARLVTRMEMVRGGAFLD